MKKTLYLPPSTYSAVSIRACIIHSCQEHFKSAYPFYCFLNFLIEFYSSFKFRSPCQLFIFPKHIDYFKIILTNISSIHSHNTHRHKPRDTDMCMHTHRHTHTCFSDIKYIVTIVINVWKYYWIYSTMLSLHVFSANRH